MLLRYSLLLLLLAPQTPPATEPIHTVYDNYWKWTEIKTNWLYVRNDPDQFLQVKLIARYLGKQMPKNGPRDLQIEVISNAPKFLYGARPGLIAIADGDELHIGNVEPHPNMQLLGMFKGGKEGGQSMVNTLSPVPQTAAILSKHKSQELVGEWLVTDISWKNLSALSKAAKIDWKLGDTTFAFNDIQLTRLRQFVVAVTPESGVVIIPEKKSESVIETGTRADTPSDANNTSLKDTLAWLKKTITKYAAESSGTGQPESLAINKFDGCKIEYQVIPQGPYTVARMIQAYSLNLKDLEPATVEVAKSGNQMWLRFASRDQQQSIKLDYRDSKTNELRSSESRPLNSAQIQMKANDLGPDIKVAFQHAVKLCQ